MSLNYNTETIAARANQKHKLFIVFFIEFRPVDIFYR